jgi:hypothetical protein
LGLKARGEEDEVTSPVKPKENVDGAVVKAKKALVLDEQDEPGEAGQKVTMSMDVNRGIQSMHVENLPLEVEGEEKFVGQEDGKRKGTFRRTPRFKVGEGSEKQVKEVGRKRSSCEIGSDVEKGDAESKERELAEDPNKRAKVAGLADQPCMTQ